MNPDIIKWHREITQQVIDSVSNSKSKTLNCFSLPAPCSMFQMDCYYCPLNATFSKPASPWYIDLPIIGAPRRKTQSFF